jgi:predicted nucleic acid-binding protein
MAIYLDTNIFYYAYCPVEKSEEIDWLFAQLKPDFYAIASEWIIIEMYRALKKQVNQKTIDDAEAQVMIDYFMTDINEMKEKSYLKLIPVTIDLLIKGRIPIFKYNLYAADAIHLMTAKEWKVDAFISFDTDFQRHLENIKVISPKSEDFKTEIRAISKKYQ